ncbi:MAG: endo-1,4-beta-xylanase [Spirochaetales bacterium]|nr:endo-1,4-beta-xylanase [Spirochaetales bacterium]
MNRNGIKKALFILLALLLMQGLLIAQTGERLRVLGEQNGKLIGYATQDNFQSVNNAARYQEIARTEFAIVTSENSMKMQSLQPNRGQFNWGTADNVVRFAQQNNILVHGHTLVWHSQSPSWIQNLRDRNSMITGMYEHIDAVLNHFKGKCVAWDVVNEAFNEDGTFRRSFWYNTIGEDFIDLAFKRAAQVDPNIKLIYNDYNMHVVSAKSTGAYNMIKGMLQRGIKVDGVGFQMHLTDTGINYDSFAQNMQRFADLGLEIWITEMDVRINPNASTADYENQAKIYKSVMQKVMQQPACTVFQVWGITDQYSWVPQTFPGTDNPLLFDRSYNPKPAYYAVQEALMEGGTTMAPTDVPTPTPTVDPNANLIVNAAGTKGGEIIEIHAAGEIVDTFTLTTTMTEYSTRANGQISVYFTNDDNVDNGLDVQLDYIIYNGEKFEAEDQATNTAVWQDSSCGGSNSEMMHCSGYILFDGTGPSETEAPTQVVTPTPPPNPDVELAVVPANKQVQPGQSLTLAIEVTTLGNSALAAYGIDINFNTSYLLADTTTEASAAKAGSQGFLAAANAATPGKISATGFDVNGIGPGSDMELLVIYLKATSTEGTSEVGISINNLTAPSAEELGGRVAGSTVTVSTGGTTCVLKGDGNGDGLVNIVDALLAAQVYVGLPIVTTVMEECLDVNCDNVVNIVDALLIAQIYVGSISSFPC